MNKRKQIMALPRLVHFLDKHLFSDIAYGNRVINISGKDLLSAGTPRQRITSVSEEKLEVKTEGEENVFPTDDSSSIGEKIFQLYVLRTLRKLAQHLKYGYAYPPFGPCGTEQPGNAPPHSSREPSEHSSSESDCEEPSVDRNGNSNNTGGGKRLLKRGVS